jgi:lipopolysaccharide export system protein LptA
MKAKIAAALLALAAAVTPAGAQITRGGGPIQIEADEGEILPSENTAIFSRNVVVVQGQSTLRTARLRVVYRSGAAGAAAGGNQEIDKIFADGEVFYVTPLERARGDRAVYDGATDTITLYGNVVLTRGQDVLRGDTLTIEQSTRRSVISADRGRPERVRGVFFPQSQPQQGAAPR